MAVSEVTLIVRPTQELPAESYGIGRDVGVCAQLDIVDLATREKLVSLSDVSARLYFRSDRLERIAASPPDAQQLTLPMLLANVADIEKQILALSWTRTGLREAELSAEFFAQPGHCQIPLSNDNTISWRGPKGGSLALTLVCRLEPDGRQVFDWGLSHF